MIALAVCVSQAARQKGEQQKGNPEANRLAREGAEASKAHDYNKAVELLRKASELDHKYATDLSDVYQQRGYASAQAQKYQDAIADFNEALKIDSRDARIYEQRATVEVKMKDYDKALADYSEAIKLKPDEVRLYLYRGYIYEAKGDLKNSMADTEKVLKQDPGNKEAQERKKRLETRQAANAPFTPVPAPPHSSPKGSPGTPKKP